MKKYRYLAVFAAAVMAMSAFSGCGAKKTDDAGKDTAAAVEEEPKVPVIEETDFMSFIFEDGGENYLRLTLDELNQKTDNAYTEANAKEYDLDYDYAIFDYGELDGIFCGRAKFEKKLPVECQLTVKDNKILKITYTINEGDGVDAKSVSDSIAKCLADSLPEDYNAEYDRKPEGKDSAVFANTVDGYVFTVKHNDIDGSGYPVLMSLETYKDKYGME